MQDFIDRERWREYAENARMGYYNSTVSIPVMDSCSTAFPGPIGMPRLQEITYIGGISEDPTPERVECAYCGREYRKEEDECPGCSARVTIAGEAAAKIREAFKHQYEQMQLRQSMNEMSYPAPDEDPPEWLRKEPSRFSRLMELVGWRV